jgi:hypothetical protein
MAERHFGENTGTNSTIKRRERMPQTPNKRSTLVPPWVYAADKRNERVKKEKNAKIQQVIDRDLPENVQVTEISYRLMRNIGNYENETIELRAPVHQGESATDVARALKKQAVDTLEVLGRIQNAAEQKRRNGFEDYEDL